MIALKKQHGPEELLLWLFLYLPVVWAALLIAQSMGGGLLDVIEQLTESLQNPLSVRWTEYSLPAIGVSVAFSTLIGVVFGLLPATQAANLNPIQALRRD